MQIAFRAGKIDGSLQASETRIALADLLTGATALELGMRSRPTMSATFG